MRFLHIADAHLDTSFGSHSEETRRRLRDASREAFQRAVSAALNAGVDAMLIAGDLFDGERLSFQTERFLLTEVARLTGAGITVVYATGNHDPGGPTTGPRSLDWPAGVVVVSGPDPMRIEIPSRTGGTTGWVTAAGHEGPRETRDLSRGFPRPTSGHPEVALLHTQVHSSSGADGHHPYAPSDLSHLCRAGFDYWALGHVHLPQRLAADPPVWYAGSLQGRNPGETGPHGGLLVELDPRSGATVSFHPFARIRWERLRVDGITDAASLDALVGLVERRWKEERTADPGAPGTEWILRVELAGPSPLWKELGREEDRETLADELGERVGALDVTVRAEAVHPVLSLEEHRHRVDVLGEVLGLAEAIRGGHLVLPGVRVDELAGASGASADELAAYIRLLLDDADGILAARLLVDPGRPS